MEVAEARVSGVHQVEGEVMARDRAAVHETAQGGVLRLWWRGPLGT